MQGVRGWLVLLYGLGSAVALPGWDAHEWLADRYDECR